ncbi:MAG TPA: YafY family protein, partial [Mycobacterium sp.]
HTVATLAARLDVDARTVRRYAAHLIDLGIPVRAVRGRYGGYRLGPGYRMPPLMLSDDEAVAVLLGLVAGRRAGLVTTSVAAAESAAAKLSRVLPEALARRIAALLDTAEFTPAAHPVTTPGTEILLTVAEAARDRRPVAITYTSTGDRRSERTVHPHGIVAHSGRWYVVGVDSETGTTRTFRLDRISTPHLLDGTFDVPAGFNAAEEVLSGFARMPYRYEISLRVEGSVDDVRRRLPPAVATVHDGDEKGHDGEEEGWVRVRINAERLDWVPAVLAGLGVPFVIEGPDALRDLVRTLSLQLRAAAGDACGGGAPGSVQH